MQLGMIGLGRMGANMAMRLMKAGHRMHRYDSHPNQCRNWSSKELKVRPV